MSTLQLSIDGVQIKRPTEFIIEKYPLTKSGRVASGKMTMDLIAWKLKFNFRYESISSTDLNVILQLLGTNNMFHTLCYTDGGEQKSATVYVGAIPKTLFRTGCVWYWKNVAFSLIEQ